MAWKVIVIDFQDMDGQQSGDAARWRLSMSRSASCQRSVPKPLGDGSGLHPSGCTHQVFAWRLLRQLGMHHLAFREKQGCIVSLQAVVVVCRVRLWFRPEQEQLLALKF